MKTSESPAKARRAGSPTPAVPAPQRGHRADIRRILTEPRLQAKLTVNQPGDEHEREADRVADEVIRGGAAVSTVSAGAPPDPVQRRSTAAAAPASMEAPASVHQTLGSPGRPLERRLRERLERPFGADFSGVQIHPDSPSASDVSARAYTVGSHIAFAPGEYAPGTASGDRLLAHELTHVVQQSGSTARLQRDGNKKKEDETEAPNPIADWKLSAGSVILVKTDTQILMIPGGKLAWIPNAADQTKFDASKGHFATDLGTLFEVPATGASGTRIFKAGTRTALVLDAGSNPMRAVPSAVYLNEFQAIMANLGVTKLERVQVIHVHKDHVSEIANIVAQYNVRAQDLVIPRPYVGTTSELRQVVNTLQTTTDAALVAAGFGARWTPGTTLKDQNPPGGNVFRYSYKVGNLVVENIALRSALTTTARNPDLASYLTKVTRTTDQAKVVVLGDLRGSDLQAIRTAMEAVRPGSWLEFFSGVTTLSGFSHHVGAAVDGHVAGLVSLLDATLLRTGKLRVVEQTNRAEQSRARNDTVEAVRRLGIELVTTEMPDAAGPSAAGASKQAVQTRGPSATPHAPITSGVTTGLERIRQLIAARQTIETWTPWFTEIGAKKAVDDTLPQIDQSIQALQQALRTAAEATLRVRTGGTQLAPAAGGGRDYDPATGGTRAATLGTAVSAIPATTVAETALGTKGFELLESLRRRPEKDIPLAVAIHAAMTRGEYSDKAFQAMLASLDPQTRDSLLVGKRGGPTTKQKAFERVRGTFGFRSSVLGTGHDLSVPQHLSSGAKAGVRGVGGFLIFLEVFNNLIVPAVQAVQTSQRTYTSKNLVPFLRRLLFWQQAGVAPKLVGVKEHLASQTYEKDYAKVVDGLNKQELDALYFDEPGLSDADVMRLAVWLSYNIRNLDEFDVLFKDSDQDAVTWESPKGGDWTQAKWKVRVGRYDTSGSNSVEESWYEHPKLTQVMQKISSRIIANTQQLLDLDAKGKDTTPELEDSIGYLTGYNGKHGPRASLKTPAETTDVWILSTGNYNIRKLKRTVHWWSSSPQFWIVTTSGDRALVKGADYNTYGALRALQRERGTLGAPYSTSSIEGNLEGEVWIDMSLLDSTAPLRLTAPAGILDPKPLP
jgi:hypothetical protein